MSHYKLRDFTHSPAVTVELPCNNLRRALTIGDYAKLCVWKEGETCECVWVLITGRAEHGQYAGTIASDPKFAEAVKHGDLVAFAWNHVIDVDLREGASA